MVFGDFEYFFLRFVYNIDYVYEIFVVGFVFDASFDLIYVRLKFINYSIALSDPAI